MPSFSWCIELKISSNIYAREELGVLGRCSARLDFLGRAVDVAACCAAAAGVLRGTLGQGRPLVCISYIPGSEYIGTFLTQRFNDSVFT